MCMYEVIKAGGFTNGGLNFDAKARRGSFTPEDIFYSDIHKHCVLLTPDNWKYRFPLKKRVSGRVFSSIKGFL